MKKSGKILFISIAAFAFICIAATIILNIINPNNDSRYKRKKSTESTTVENFSSEGVKYYKFDFPYYGHAKITFSSAASDKLSISGDEDFAIIWEQKGDSIIFKSDTDLYFHPDITLSVKNAPSGINATGSEIVSITHFDIPEMEIITDNDISLEECTIDSLSATFYNTYYGINIKGESKISNLAINSSSDITISSHQIGKALFEYKVTDNPNSSNGSSVRAQPPTIKFEGKRPELTLNTNGTKIAVTYNSPTVIPAEQ